MGAYMLRTPWHGGPICCANRWCWFSFVSGRGRGIMGSGCCEKEGRNNLPGAGSTGVLYNKIPAADSIGISGIIFDYPLYCMHTVLIR
jgi:hypothetical protein